MRHAHRGQDRRLPGVVTHLRPQGALARSRVRSRKILAPGSLTTGSPAGRTPSKIGDGWLNVQSGLRKGAEGEASDSVRVVKMLRRVERSSPWSALGRRPCAVQEPEDHKRNLETIIDTLSLCKNWPPNDCNFISAKPNLLR